MASLSVDLLHTDEAKALLRLLFAMMDDNNVPKHYRDRISKALTKERREHEEVWKLLKQ